MLGKMGPRIIGRVEDPQNFLSKRSIRRIGKAISALEGNFPQVTFAVFLCRTPANVSTKLFAFWAFNKSPIHAIGASEGQNFSLVLIMDPYQREISLVIGYGFERFLISQDLEAILDQAIPSLKALNFEKGIEIIVRATRRRLRAIHSGLASQGKELP